MAVAYVQEFAIADGDTSTANYDTVVQGPKVHGILLSIGSLSGWVVLA